MAEEVPCGLEGGARPSALSDPVGLQLRRDLGSAADYCATPTLCHMNYRGFAIPVKAGSSTARSPLAGAERLDQERNGFDSDTAHVLQNLVDSHDTQRVASAIRNRHINRSP